MFQCYALPEHSHGFGLKGHAPLAVCKLFCFAQRSFDHTKGFPGEGPPWHLATLNVGSLEKHPEAMIRGFHCTAFQETRVTDCNKKHLCFTAANKGLQLECGPTMKYLNHGKAEWGGVAFSVAPGTAIPYSINDDCTGNYASLLATNRALGMWVSTDDGTSVLVFNLYLFSGAPSDSDKHCRNDALIQLTLEVIAQHGAIPAIIAADFQDIPHCYPALRDAFAAGLWHDLLMQQDENNHLTRPTTFVRDKHWRSDEFSSSIDGILVNQHALPFVSHIEVHHALGLQHAFVIASFEFGNYADRHKGYVWNPHAAFDLSEMVSMSQRDAIAEQLWNDKFQNLTDNAGDGEQLMQVANDFAIELLLAAGAKWKHGKRCRGLLDVFIRATSTLGIHFEPPFNFAFVGVHSNFLALYPKQLRRLCKVAASQSLYSSAIRSDRKDLECGCSGIMDCEVAPPGTRFQPWRNVAGYDAAIIPGALTGAAPTADRLCHSGQTENNLCRWCHKEKETIKHLAGNCDEINKILGKPFLPLEDQPNLATHGILEVPPCLLQRKYEWEGDDLPPKQVLEERVNIWGDGSCINPEHFFSKTIGFAVVDEDGHLLYKHGQHDPLGSSFKAELMALVAAVKLRGPLICYITDCKSVMKVFETLKNIAFIPANLPFAAWWRFIFEEAGFGPNCLLQVRWIRAHQYDRAGGYVDPIYLNNRRADQFATEAALASCPISKQCVRSWKQLVAIHQAWLCRLMKLISSQKDIQRSIETSDLDGIPQESNEGDDDSQLRYRFNNWDWTVPMEEYCWTPTNEPNPAPPVNWSLAGLLFDPPELLLSTLRLTS
eukprot:Skav214202  [mRNA]  locus=scaffold2153:244944:251650:- [translate_table: standard]